MNKIRFILIFTVSIVLMAPSLYSKDGTLSSLTISREMASKFALMALKCIEKEYPNKPSHVMNSEEELWGPKSMHPAFYGCFDWHSAVHGHWMLIRLLKKFPDLPENRRIRNALDRNLQKSHILKEVEYFQQKGRKSFERTYGWAWLLKLTEELTCWDDEQGRKWRKNIQPLEQEIVKNYLNFFPKQTYAIRTGVHPNTAFGLAFGLDYARKAQNIPLEKLIVERSREYYAEDENCPAAWEPGGEDFFSPCLMEADLMRRILEKDVFSRWFDNFLTGLKTGKPVILLEPAVVTDRSDGKLVHLDGLNLSRAWCMKHIAAALPEQNPAKKILYKSAILHARDALNNISSGDYAGEHWLASFATYLLTE